MLAAAGTALFVVWGAGGCQAPPGPQDLGNDCRARGPFTDQFRDVSDSAGLDVTLVSNDFRGNPVAVFDLDGDGLLDVFAASREGGMHLFANRGDLSFTEVTDEVGLVGRLRTTAAAAADFDNDGDADLVVAGSGGSLVYENLYGHFASPRPLPNIGATEYLLPVDLDGDGLLDLFAANLHHELDSLTRNRVLHNLGGLGFADVTDELLAPSPSWSWTATAMDVDGDGDLDIHVANDTLVADFGHATRAGNKRPPDALLVNSGGSDMALIRLIDRADEYGLSAPRSSMGGLPFDVDGDGDLDLMIPDYGANKLMVRGAARFENMAPSLGLQAPVRTSSGCDDTSVDRERCLLLTWGVAAEDFNLDGDIEIVAVSGVVLQSESPPPFLYFARAADGGFSELTCTSGCTHGYALAAVDMDNDGDQDLLIGPRDGKLRILENMADGAGRWLRVRLFGVDSNREGRGAVVAVETDDGKRIVRTVAPGGVAFTSQPAEVHIGLGTQVARSVEVRWPAGGRDRYLPDAGSGLVTLVEGSPSL